MNHSTILPPIKGTEFIASCDIGTSTVRCIIYTSDAKVHSSAEDKVEIISPRNGYVEIDPNDLWEKFVHVVRKSMEDANLHASQICCLGLTTQRSTFILWDKSNGKPLHNFITWKDLRADSLVRSWNSSWTMRALRLGSSILYSILRDKRYLAASIIKFQNIQVNIRLKWALENIPNVEEVYNRGDLLFGTVDSWLIYKLSGQKVHATDFSNASGTAIWDPYIKQWSAILLKILSLPASIFPEVRDTVGNWGKTERSIFGVPIPITAVVSDQGASLFGGGGITRGDVKITLGTGSFIDVNTGSKPHTSLKGIYPVIGWKDSSGIVYMAEASSNDNGTIIEWGKNMGLYSDVSQTSSIAESVSDSNGVFFVPGFQGLQTPINDACATGGFIGLSTSCRRAHFVRSMLEALAFRVTQIFETMRREARYSFMTLRVDGGVSQNDFMMQMIATLTNKHVERAKNIETSSLGCCFLAGIGAGIWKSSLDVLPLQEVAKTFHPDPDDRPRLLLLMQRWEEAIRRFTAWNKEDS